MYVGDADALLVVRVGGEQHAVLVVAHVHILHFRSVDAIHDDGGVIDALLVDVDLVAVDIVEVAPGHALVRHVLFLQQEDVPREVALGALLLDLVRRPPASSSLDIPARAPEAPAGPEPPPSPLSALRLWRLLLVRRHVDVADDDLLLGEVHLWLRR